MVSLILDRLRKSNKKIHSKILEWFSDYEYRADVFVDEVLSQFSQHLEENDISDSEFSTLAGVNKSAVSQFFNSNSNIKVKTLFKYADALDLTLQAPKLIKFNLEQVEKLYKMESTSPNIVISINEIQHIKAKENDKSDSKSYMNFNIDEKKKSKFDYSPTG